MKSIRYYRTKKTILYLLKGLIIILLCIVFVTPFIVMISTSFRTNSDAFTKPVTLFPRIWTLKNFPEAMKVIPYWRYMGNTLFITILSIAGNLISTPMVAYSLAKIKWRGSSVIAGLLMATMMIPYSVTMIPLYRVYAALHLTNTYVPLILPTFLEALTLSSSCGSSWQGFLIPFWRRPKLTAPTNFRDIPGLYFRFANRL